MGRAKAERVGNGKQRGLEHPQGRGGRGSSGRHGGPGRVGLGGTRHNSRRQRAMAAGAARTMVPVLGLRPAGRWGSRGGSRVPHPGTGPSAGRAGNGPAAGPVRAGAGAVGAQRAHPRSPSARSNPPQPREGSEILRSRKQNFILRSLLKKPPQQVVLSDTQHPAPARTLRDSIPRCPLASHRTTPAQTGRNPVQPSGGAPARITRLHTPQLETSDRKQIPALEPPARGCSALPREQLAN